MVSPKFEELFKQYSNYTDTEGRLIKIKMKEIAACYDECNLEERGIVDEIVDKFCELIERINERNKLAMDVLEYKYEGMLDAQKNGMHNFVASPIGLEAEECVHIQYQTEDELLEDFYNCFIEKKTPATMKDYVARIKTFAYSSQYLDEMLLSGILGDKRLRTSPVLFTYINIEQILAKFNTKDENGVAIKQRNNIRSALRLLNEFKRKVGH